MRKIKFRAWNKQTGKMIYSDQVYPRSMYKFEFDILSEFDFKLMKMVDRYNVTDDEVDTLPIAKARGFLVANTLIYT